MKKLSYILLSLTLLIGCNNNSSTNPSQLQVTGFASRTLKPDQLSIHVVVSLQDKNMKSAKDRMDLAQGKVWEALKQLGIEKNTVSESGVQFQRQMDYHPTAREFYYFASNSIQFKIKDFSIYESVVNAMTSIPDVNINPPQPVISNQRQIQDEVRSEAVLDAKKKAESMVKPLGLKLGKPLLMTESPQGGFERGRGMIMATAARSTPERPNEFVAGDQELSVEVSIHFEIKE